MGEIRKDKVWNLFINFPWKEYYDKMMASTYQNIHYSPSLEIENKENGTAITLSLVNMEHGLEFYIFYLRPKKVSRFFGLIKYTRTCLTDKIDQTEKDAQDAIQALLKEDLKTLEERWG